MKVLGICTNSSLAILRWIWDSSSTSLVKKDISFRSYTKHMVLVVVGTKEQKIED